MASIIVSPNGPGTQNPRDSLIRYTRSGGPSSRKKPPSIVHLRKTWQNPTAESLAFSWRRIMASYAGHLSLSAVVGAGYGSSGVFCYQLDWGPALRPARLTTIGGGLA